MTKTERLELAFDNVERVGIVSKRLKALSDFFCRYLEHTCDLDGTLDERLNALQLVKDSGNMNELSCIMLESVQELEELFEILIDCVGSLRYDKEP